ncbi:hypothetical protein [Rhodohalobacter sp. 614A]|uniref:hypothetical protein n=1 Tax=Rhodohalobacter sp. 614A TaxID=2908649 RepID=UPI001F45D539|nr:hypothetical protein [Rhodohalobacter sp. 614A]
MENKIIELIQAEIDSENSPEESKKLESILNNNEEAQSLHHDLLEISEKMKDLKSEFELPEGISMHISKEIAKKPKTGELKNLAS